jgi:Carboxypeptidase regulatory-like domain
VSAYFPPYEPYKPHGSDWASHCGFLSALEARFGKGPVPRLHSVLACATLLLCLVPVSASAQQQTAELEVRRSSLPGAPLAKTPGTEGSASVTGTVLDLSGATVPGADVRLMHRDGTQLKTTLSEVNGEFNFIQIPAGSYLVMVNAKGFALFTSAEFVVTVASLCLNLPVPRAACFSGGGRGVLLRSRPFDPGAIGQGSKREPPGDRSCGLIRKRKVVGGYGRLDTRIAQTAPP